MQSKFSVIAGCLFFLLLICKSSVGQNSALVNFGSSSCGTTAPSFSVIKNPLSASPALMADCNFSQQQASYFGVLVAYNPKDNKLYIADSRTGTQTNIWVLDIGLPVNIQCPATIPVAPNYSYPYVSTNFEFDNNGDLWSLSAYDITTGQSNIDKFDVNTGNTISTKRLQFPLGNFPTTTESGDLTILPNGRMFAVFGNSPCRLYEIINYNDMGGMATAMYLATMPRDCYGIAYINGALELTGFSAAGCYYYDYTIATGALGLEKAFQNGQTPIDNTSFTPAPGCTKRLLSATKINGNTADLVYEVYAENLGNVILNNINLTDDLAAVFGTGNVSNVSASFVPGSNAANLVLNPAYNGTSVTSLLNAGQNLPNKVLANRDFFVKLQVSCRATNLNPNVIYQNAAIVKADIGSSSVLTAISVADSSNNGDSTVIDPNNNGNAGDAGENVPTPFNFTVLPVRFVNVNALQQNNNIAVIKWQVATPIVNASNFDVEYSVNGTVWEKAGTIVIENSNRSNYQFSHLNMPPGNIYYRIRQTDNDGTFIYSRIILLHKEKGNNGYTIYPNPANNYISISAGYHAAGKAELTLYDATGRKLINKTMSSSTEGISTAGYPAGSYLLKILNDGNVLTHKVIIQH